MNYYNEIKSKIIDNENYARIKDYSKEKQFKEESLKKIMCSDTNGDIKSEICTQQREGYDLCPAVKKCRDILTEEYNKNNDKSYRLKADMGKYGNDFYVSKIYFYNGGSITFDIDYGYEMSLDKKGRMACQYHENEDKEWCFRFYGEQIKNIWDEVKENTR